MDQFSYSMFPNSVRSELEIHIENLQIEKIFLTNILGKRQMIMDQINSSKFKLDLSNLVPAVYILELCDKNNNIVYKSKLIKI